MARAFKGFGTRFKTQGDLVDRISVDSRFWVNGSDVYFRYDGDRGVLLVASVNFVPSRKGCAVCVLKYDGRYGSDEQEGLFRSGYAALRAYVIEQEKRL